LYPKSSFAMSVTSPKGVCPEACLGGWENKRVGLSVYGIGVQQPSASLVLRVNFFPVKRFSMVLSVSAHRYIAVTSIKVTNVLEKLSIAHVL
jgi:hypothetical protein